MNKRFSRILTCLFFSLFCLLSICLSPSVAYADTGSMYTNVLYDLQKDENFDVMDYPVDMSDYSLHVIQVAESINNELFVYVYQPCSPNNDLLATSINISKSTGRNLSYINHGLTLLNSNGTLYKYRVNRLTVSNLESRHYNISSIFRKWNEEYDSGLPVHNENTISEVAFEVATEWIATTETNEVVYTATSTEVITITDKYVGFVRYDGSYESRKTSTISHGRGSIGNNQYVAGFDSHFIAFNTDKPIDKLLSAQIYFTTQDFEYRCSRIFTAITSEESTYSNLENNSIELNYTDVGNGHGNRRDYTWERIQTSEDLLSTEDKSFLYTGIFINYIQEQRMTAESIEDLQNMQWVLRFYESEFIDDEHYLLGTGDEHVKWTGVADVSILRLEFEVDKDIYTLGVVDNKQTGDGVPDNETLRYIESTELSLGIGDFFGRIWQGIAGFFKAIFSILKIAFWVVVIGGAVFLIVKLVISIVRRKKNKRADSRIKKTRTPIRRKKKGTIKNYRRKYVKKVSKEK